MLHRLPAVAHRSGRLIPVQHGKDDAEQDDQRIQSVRVIASFFSETAQAINVRAQRS